jgi:kinetochore protein Nuf2
MNAVGILDFSIRDLIKPDPLRLKLILSATINFVKFREEQSAVFEKYVERLVRTYPAWADSGIIRDAT